MFLLAGFEFLDRMVHFMLPQIIGDLAADVALLSAFGQVILLEGDQIGAQMWMIFADVMDQTAVVKEGSVAHVAQVHVLVLAHVHLVDEIRPEDAVA